MGDRGKRGGLLVQASPLAAPAGDTVRDPMLPGPPPLLPFPQAYCLAPFDLIKVRLQNQTEPRAKPGSPAPRYRGPVHCAVTVFREEGPRGLLRGSWALALRDTPTLGMYFVTYEWICRRYTPEGLNPSKRSSWVGGGRGGSEPRGREGEEGAS